MGTKRLLAKKRFYCVLLVLCIMSTSLFGGFSVNAVSYEGKGTKKNPYLVTTSEQLNGIRENLSAHYKLAATIDMSSFGNFTAIGDPSKPFTGSFVCDTDSSGKPIYAITNLVLHFQGIGCTRNEGFSNFKEDGSMGWTVALFGATDGASFDNIVLLNADVSSNVEGLYSVNSDWTVNPTSHQATGSLIASATNTNISGCGATGKVVSSSNAVGGLIGLMKEGTIKNSYSYVSVTSTGTWGSAGFLGYVDGKASIKSCFYSGTFSGGVTHAGAFVGSLKKEVSINDCWAAGTVMTETSGCFGGVDNHDGGTQPEITSISKNCYTLAKINGRTKAQTNKRVINNCYVTNEVGGLEVGFAAGDMATINGAFKGLDAWVVADGTYPQLKNVHAVTSIEELGKSASSEQQSTAGKSEGNDSTETSDDPSVETADKTKYILKSDITNNVAALGKKDRIFLFTISGILFLTLMGTGVTVAFVLRDRYKCRVAKFGGDAKDE